MLGLGRRPARVRCSLLGASDVPHRQRRHADRRRRRGARRGPRAIRRARHDGRRAEHRAGQIQRRGCRTRRVRSPASCRAGPAEPSYHFVGVQVAEAEAFASLPDNGRSSRSAALYPALIAARPGSVRAFVIVGGVLRHRHAGRLPAHVAAARRSRRSPDCRAEHRIHRRPRRATASCGTMWRSRTARRCAVHRHRRRARPGATRRGTDVTIRVAARRARRRRRERLRRRAWRSGLAVVDGSTTSADDVRDRIDAFLASTGPGRRAARRWCR